MIGRMERVDLREVWKNEARDFTSWLFDNIDILRRIRDQLSTFDISILSVKR